MKATPTVVDAGPLSSAVNWPKPRQAWYLVGVLHIAYVFSMVDRISFGQLVPYLKADLGLTDTQLGLVQGIGFAVCYTMFGLVFGWATDRWSRRTLVGIGIAVWSIATVASGFAIGFWSLALARVGVAVGEATLAPAASSLIADSFAAEGRPRAFGIFQMGAALGSLLAYLLGGGLLLWLDHGVAPVLPVVGRLEIWQIVFIALGVPGICVALLMATVREPTRQGIRSTKGTAGWSELWQFLTLHRHALLTLNIGVALVMMSVYGWLFWLTTFFLRTYAWSVGYTGVLYGLTGGVIGVLSAAISGPVTDWLSCRGYQDAAMRTCAIGAIGCAILGAAAPLMPTAWLALLTLCLWKLFVNLPTSAALTTLNEITPNELRGKVTAVYILTLGVLASGSGSLVVALVTDDIFGNEAAVGKSLALVSAVAAGSGAVLLCLGLKSFGRARMEAAIT